MFAAGWTGAQALRDAAIGALRHLAVCEPSQGLCYPFPLAGGTCNSPEAASTAASKLHSAVSHKLLGPQAVRMHYACLAPA